MQQQAPAQEGYSALDTPMTGRAEGAAREPIPLGTYYFSFQNLIRGLPSSPQFDADGTKERCKFVFKIEEVIRARSWTRSAEFPNPRKPAEFVGEEFHHYCNFYAAPTPRMEIHKVISAIIGHTLDANEDFIPRDHLGAWVEVIIGLSETNKPKLTGIQPCEYEEVEDTNDGFEPEPEPVAPVGRGRRSAPPTNGQPF